MTVLPSSAIRPYPSQYTTSFVTKNSETIRLRPIRPDDECKIRDFHQGLSEQSVYSRYLKPFNLSERTTHARLTRMCFIDYDREIAIVALSQNSESGSIVAVARLKKNFSKTQGELSVIVVDALQRQGLGLELIKRLLHVAKDESLEAVTAFLLPDNTAMRVVLEKLGFSFSNHNGGLIAVRRLRD